MDVRYHRVRGIMKLRKPAFTLVEILIVVVILGILAAIVVPQFASATSDASKVAAKDQLTKLRRALAAYYVRNGGVYPEVQAGDGTWGTLVGAAGGFMREAPINSWVPAGVSRQVILGTSADSGYQTTYGWIFNPLTGDVWAGGFDVSDNPYPRP